MKLKSLLNYLFENEKYEVEKRSHMSSVPIEEIRNIPLEEQGISEHKPKGFWYDCNDAWSNWVEVEMPEWKHEHIYEIKLDHLKIKVIRNIEDLATFTEKYGSEEDFGLINWQHVARDFYGIEICPYIFKARFETKFRWYHYWDVASGCIWNKKAIESF